MFETGLIIASCAVVTCLLTMGGMVARYEKRHTKTEGAAASALQVAAEAAEELKGVKEELATIERRLLENNERMRHEFGETIDALRQKIHDFEKWSRDEFIRKLSFEAVMARTEKAQEVRDERLEKRLSRIEDKLDAAVAGRPS